MSCGVYEVDPTKITLLKSKSELIWEKFVYLSRYSEKFPRDTKEWVKLNNICWDLLDQWLDAYIKEFTRKMNSL